jgi:hypothetical protein
MYRYAGMEGCAQGGRSGHVAYDTQNAMERWYGVTTAATSAVKFIVGFLRSCSMRSLQDSNVLWLEWGIIRMSQYFHQRSYKPQ